MLTLHFTQGMGALAKLQVLDVAGNKLSMFPVEVQYTVLGNAAAQCCAIVTSTRYGITMSLYDAGHCSV